jgi:hypothetical protein
VRGAGGLVSEDSRRPGGCHSGLGASSPESIQIEGKFAWKFPARRAAPSELGRNTFSKGFFESPGSGNKAEIFFHFYFQFVAALAVFLEEVETELEIGFHFENIHPQ